MDEKYSVENYTKAGNHKITGFLYEKAGLFPGHSFA